MIRFNSVPPVCTRLSSCVMPQITRIFHLKLVFIAHNFRLQSSMSTRYLKLRMILHFFFFCMNIKPAFFFQDANSSQNVEMEDSRRVVSVTLTQVIPELSTANSIYPCLDTFDIVLSRSEQSGRLLKRPVSAKHVPERHLIRLYRAPSTVVERIACITRRHRVKEKTNHDWLRKHSYRHFQAKRFSKLLELRELNYVGEYSVSPDSPLVKLRCDVFDPIEDSFYCFVYLILLRSIVLYEDLPHCVPITAPTAVESESGHSEPLEQWARINHPLFTSEAPFTITDNQTSFERIRSLLIPPGPAYETINSKQSERALIDEREDSSEEENIRQYALTSAFQSDHHNEIGHSKPLRKVTVQTYSCQCMHQAHSPFHNLQHELLQLNLSYSETTIVNLIISTCPASDGGSAPNDIKITHNLLETTTLRYNGEKSNHTRIHYKKKRKKHKKHKRSQDNKIDTKTQGYELERNEPTWQMGMSISKWPQKMACVLAIDQPTDYTMRLESIDPSMAWPSELLTLLGHQALLPIDLIDYLDKYPILIIRKGQLTIDPQMNIENRSQIYYLNSQHLRFEASSSMNVTLRFKRLFHSASDWLARSNQPEQSLPGTFMWLMKRTVSTIALKIIDLSGADNKERRALGGIPLFHLISILLSAFIILTLLIYIVIAVTGARNSARDRRVEIVSEAQMIVDCHSQVSTVIAVAEQTPLQRSQFAERSPNPSASPPKFDVQSLELDYYDYSQPLMLHSAYHSSLPKSVSSVERKEDVSNESMALSHSLHFCTLPIRVNCGEALEQYWPVPASPSKCPLINDHSALDHTRSDITAQASIHSSTLTRTTFTKPPILLSTFTRNE